MQQNGIRIVAVGDLQMGDSPTCVGFGFRSRCGPDDLSRVLAGVRPLLAGADMAFGNLETPLSDSGLVPGDWASVQLRGSPAYAPALRAAGFTILNVANNHAAQHGNDVFRDSRRILAEAGLASCGVRGSAPWASEPVVLSTRAGPRVGVLGYCLRPRQYGSEVPPYAEGDPESIRADVARLRETTDYVVVSLHWGEEFVGIPSAAEVSLGRSLIDAGAVLVIGHHPHVVRPCERYRHGLIAYSLGNFAGDMSWYAPFRRGGLLQCVLTNDGVNDASMLATRMDDDLRVAVGAEAGADPVEKLEGLSESDYQAEIRRTQREQRHASYGFALRHLHRYRPTMLGQLAARTLLNKVGGLVGRSV